VALHFPEESMPDPLSPELRGNIEFVDDAGAGLSGNHHAFGGRKRCRQTHDEASALSPFGLREQEEPASFSRLPNERPSVGGTEA
jgi:hypothetical protein